MSLRHSDSFFGIHTSISLMFGVERVKRNVPRGHSTWREQMLQTHWVIKISGAITATSSIFKDFYGIGTPTFFTLWKGRAEDPQALWRPARWWYLGGQHPAPIWELSKLELFAYYLPQTNKSRGFIWNIISFPPLSAPTFKKPPLSQPGLRSNSSLVKCEGHRADSRIPDVNFRLTFICSFLPPFPLLPSRTGSSATHGENLFLPGLLETPRWVKLTCQSCLDVTDEKSSHWCFWREKAGKRDICSPERVHKGRRHRSLFPRDQIKLAPKVYLQWCTANSEHPQGATLAQAALDLPALFGTPCTEGCGEVCCEVVLRGCTKEV